MRPICYLTPDNFSHKAGDGPETRKRRVAGIHPALTGPCGVSQTTCLLEEEEPIRIEVIGSLNPGKAIQDRVNVYSPLGLCQCIRATDYKDPPKIVVGDE